MSLVTKASVTMPCETYLLGNLKIPVVVYSLYRFYFMLSWVSCGRNKMALESVSHAGNHVAGEMGSLLHQLYVATGVNLSRKFMTTNGCCISLHRSSESWR